MADSSVAEVHIDLVDGDAVIMLGLPGLGLALRRYREAVARF